MAQYESQERRNRHSDMEPMVIAGPWHLAISISGYHDDRKNPGNVFIRVMLDCTRFISGTYKHVHLHGSKCYEREDEDAGPARLRVLLHAKILFFSGTSQEYSTMYSDSQYRLAHGSRGILSGNHDKGRGEGPLAVQILHSVHVLWWPVLQHGDAVSVANIRRKRTKHHCPTDGLSRLRHCLQFTINASLCVCFFPSMFYRYRHVQHHDVGVLFSGHVRRSCVWPDRHRNSTHEGLFQGRRHSCKI